MRRNLLILFTLSAFVNIQITLSAASERQVSSDLDGRIINGTLAQLNDTKHQVSIRNRTLDADFFGAGQSCGGSLIRPNVVLSAAHCFVNYFLNTGEFYPAEDFIVVMGNLDIFERNNYTLVFDIKEIVFNVSIFNLYTYEHDIALLFLNDSVPANHTRAKPIELDTNQESAGTICQVTGWGKTEKAPSSDILMTVDVPIMDDNVCAHNMSFVTGVIREGMLCAGYAQGGRNVCNGDSGGPLVCNNKLTGIVSWGFGCALPLLPAIYTNVSYWSPWIESKLGSGAGENSIAGLAMGFGLICGFALNRI